MEEHLTSFLSSKSNDPFSYIFTHNDDYPIDHNDTSVENGLEFKENDLQENYWNIDELEDCITNEQLVFKKPHNISSTTEEEHNLFSEKTRDYSNEAHFTMFLKRKRILKANSVVKEAINTKMSNKAVQKGKRLIIHNKNTFDLINNK